MLSIVIIMIIRPSKPFCRTLWHVPFAKTWHLHFDVPALCTCKKGPPQPRCQGVKPARFVCKADYPNWLFNTAEFKQHGWHWLPPSSEVVVCLMCTKSFMYLLQSSTSRHIRLGSNLGTPQLAWSPQPKFVVPWAPQISTHGKTLFTPSQRLAGYSGALWRMFWAITCES